MYTIGLLKKATYSSRREKVLSNIKELRSQVGQATFDEEREAFETALKLEIQSLGRLNEDELQSKRFAEADKMDAIGEDDEDSDDDLEKN